MNIFCNKSILQLLLQVGVIISSIAVPIGGSLQALDVFGNRVHQSACKSCGPTKVITCLPYTIMESGSYCLAEDFDLRDPTVKGAAIVVMANDVDIDFKDHTIELNPLTVGISACNVSNLSVHNGTIKTIPFLNTAVSIALVLDTVNNASFEKMICLNTFNGALLTNCTDQLFLNCKFDGHDSGIVVPSNGFQSVTIEGCEFGKLIDTVAILFSTGGKELAIHNCKFFNLPNHINLQNTDNQLSNVQISGCEFTASESINTTLVSVQLGGSGSGPNGLVENVQIQNCFFTNIGESGISAVNCSGLLLEDCFLQAAAKNNMNLLQLASFGSTDLVADMVIRKCIFSNQQAAPRFDGVFIASAQGVLFDDCIFDSNPAGDVFYPNSANVHIHGASSDGFSATDGVKLVNCVIRNQASCGICCDGSFNSSVSPVAVEIDNCLIDGALDAGVRFDNATTSVVKNSQIANTANGPGILVVNGSQFNVILDNTVVKNKAQGISLDLSSPFNTIRSNMILSNGSDGIAIASNTNDVEENTLSCNVGYGINNTGDSTNEFYNNVACNNNNAGSDFTGVPFVVSPGQFPVIAGGNVGCTP